MGYFLKRLLTLDATRLMGIILIAVSAVAQRVVAFGARLEQLKKNQRGLVFSLTYAPTTMERCNVGMKSSNVQ